MKHSCAYWLVYLSFRTINTLLLSQVVRMSRRQLHWATLVCSTPSSVPLDLVSRGADRTLFKKGCLNRFKAPIQYVLSLCVSLFLLQNVASYLIPLSPLKKLPDSPLLATSYPPRQEISDLSHLYSTQSFIPSPAAQK